MTRKFFQDGINIFRMALIVSLEVLVLIFASFDTFYILITQLNYNGF